MQDAPPDYVVSLTPSEAGWAWRVTPPNGAQISGLEADLATAQRSAAFAEGVVRSLDRARRRRG
jgi:hypothetical protein